ncbi:hypothetical protein [Roseicyclus marinus]|uniref:hypothetical protein n=1 Tax=Roseicyclus marinus TaxID=2161673 RepID=UPI00240F453A|nr:hypothetical protein [Roseicyclus marinus]MDG3040396.1 hypothetical protein [Roseicyclus marinus]
MERFSWRPALLARRREVRVSDEGLYEGAGPLWAWADLEEIGWTHDVLRGAVIVTLRLHWGRREVRLGYRGRGPVPGDCARMLRAVMCAAAAARPGMGVVLGHGGGARRDLFAMAVVLFVAGLAAVLLGLWWFVTADPGEALGPGIAGAVVSAMAVGIAAGNRPWVAPPEVPVAEVVARIEALAEV